MITDAEKEKISKEVKGILDSFALKLSKVKITSGARNAKGEGFRTFSDMQNDSGFRDRMFENAIEKNGDYIVAERKKW